MEERERGSVRRDGREERARQRMVERVLLRKLQSKILSLVTGESVGFHEEDRTSAAH